MRSRASCVYTSRDQHQDTSEPAIFLLVSVAKANLERWEPASSMSGVDDDVPSQGPSVGTDEKMSEMRDER